MSDNDMGDEGTDFKIHEQAGGVLFARGRTSDEWLEYDGHRGV